MTDHLDRAAYEALVAELVRDGVLREETRRLDDGLAYTTRDREGVVRTGGRPQTKQRRYVTAWEPDTRTPQQRSDDAPPITRHVESCDQEET